MLDVVHAMFPNVLLLNHCKRGSARARKLIEDVTRMLFPQGQDTHDRTHEEEAELVKAVVAMLPPCTNLAGFKGQVVTYLRDSAIHANKLMHATHMKSRSKMKLLTGTTRTQIDKAIKANKCIQATDRLYHVGQVLKCTSGYLSGKWRVVTGRDYTVVDIDPKGLWLRDPTKPIVDAPAALAPAKPKRGRPSKKAAATLLRPQRDGAHPIEWKGATWQYDYGHAITCHKLQGSSLAASILLVDGDSKHVTAEWLLVALTRSLTGEVFRYSGTELANSRHEPYDFFKRDISGHVTVRGVHIEPTNIPCGRQHS